MHLEGLVRYEIREFDTLSAIAVTYGTTWEDIYEDPANADFRRLRPDPNVIMPGDVIYIRKGDRKEPERFQLGIWEGEISQFNPSSPLVGIKLTLRDTRHCRFDSGKGVFIDAPLYGPDAPPEHHMTPFKEKIRQLYLTAEQLRVERLEAENKALKEELARLKSPRPYVSTTEEECRGGCSRGGDGPCCGKRGCRG